MRKNLIKTKFAGIYYEQDTKTKIKTYIARINITGVINTEQVVGYSNDAIRTNPSIAYEKRIELINKIKNGESIKAKENPSLEIFFNEYMKSREQTLSKHKQDIYKYFFKKHIPKNLQKKYLKQITTDDFQKVIDKMIKEEYKPSYIKEINLFSPMFRNAIEKGLVSKNVIKNLKLPKYDNNRYFTLPEEKVKLLYQNILDIPDNQYRAMFLFLLRGRRAGEVLSLEWQNIDLINKKYKILDSQSKIRKTLTFTLDEEIIDAINCLNKKDSGLVFVNQRTGKKFYSFPQKLWRRIKINCDITDMKLHDFRHMLGMTLVNNDVPLEYISKALGHSKITTTQMYSNQKEKMAADAVNSYLKLIK